MTNEAGRRSDDAAPAPDAIRAAAAVVRRARSGCALLAADRGQAPRLLAMSADFVRQWRISDATRLPQPLPAMEEADGPTGLVLRIGAALGSGSPLTASATGTGGEPLSIELEPLPELGCGHGLLRVEAVSESPALLRTIVEASPVSISVKNDAGRFMLVNRRFIELNGLPREAILGRTLEELRRADGLFGGIGTEAVRRLTAAESELLSGAEEYVIENAALRTVEGDERWLQMRKVPLRLDDGRTTGILGMASDVTERRRAELALEARRRRSELVNEISARLITAAADEVEEVVRWALERTCRFFAIDRGAISLFAGGTRRVERLIHWVRPDCGLPAPAWYGQDFGTAFPWLLSELATGRTVVASSADDLPATAAAEREVMSAIPASLFVTLPIQVGGDLIGTLAFSCADVPPVWEEAATTTCRLIGELLGQALSRSAAHRALTETRALLESITNRVPDAVFRWQYRGGHGRMLFLSPAFETVTGYARGTVFADPLGTWRAIDRESRTLIKNVFRQAIDRRAPVRVDVQMRHGGNGERRWVRLSAAPVPGASEGEALYDGVLSDVTAEKESERRLREARNRLSAVTAALPGAVFQGTIPDPDGPIRLSYVSAGIEKLVGCTPEQLIEDSTRWMTRIDPAARERLWRGVRKLALDGVPWRDEFDALTPDGVRKRLQIVATAEAVEGEPVQITGTILDITDSAAAREELAAANEKVSRISTLIPGYVFELEVEDIDRAIWVYAGEGVEELIGIEPNRRYNLYEDGLFERIFDADSPSIPSTLLGKIARREPYSTVRRMRDEQGGIRWIRSVARPVVGADGTVSYFGVSLDVTRAQEADAALAESQQRLELAMRGARLGLIDWDIASGEVVCNDRIFEMLGLEPPPMPCSVAALDALEHPGDRALKQRRLEAHFAGETADFECQFRQRAASGKYRWVLLRGRVMERDADGRPLRFIGVQRDVTEQVASQRELQHRVVFSRLVSRLASDFVRYRSGDIPAGIDQALALVGRFAGVDRAYVIVYRPDSTIADNTNEWVAPGVEAQKDLLQGFDMLREYPYVYRRQQAREVVNIESVARLAEVAPTDARHLAAQSIRSLVVVPVVVAGRTLGCIGFDSVRREKRWSAADVSLLRIVSEMIGNALHRRDQELALARSERQLREIARALPGMVFQMVRGASGSPRLTFASRGATRIPGFDHVPLRQGLRRFADLVHPDDLPALARAVDVSAATLTRLEQDVRLRGEADERWVRISAFPAGGENAETVWNGLLLDVTAYRKAQEALAASEARYRELYDTTPVMMLSLDAEGVIVSVNRHLMQTLGYGERELVGRRLADMIARECAGQHERHFEALMQSGSLSNASCRFICRDGSVVDALVSARTRVDAAGRVAGATASMIDVTQLKRAEDALRRSEEQYRAIVRDQTEMICRLDPDLTLTFVNPAMSAALAAAPEKLVGRGFLGAFPERRRAAVAEMFDSVSREHPVVERQLTFEDAAGSKRWWRAHVRAFFDRDGRLRGYQLVARDETARRQLEQDILAVSDRERRAIGHDLHDGLGQELTGLSLLLKSLEPEMRERLPESAELVEELQSTVTQAIATTRSLAHGLAPVQLERWGLGGALEQLARDTARASGLRCICDARELFGDVEPEVAFNLFRIAQEAATNAVRHGACREIRIALSASRTDLVLTVADDGAGFDIAAVPDGAAGGLGLRSMRYRADVIGAELEIASTPGAGTTVRCRYRYDRPASATAGATPSSRTESA